MKQKGLPNHWEPLRYALEVWQERQDSNLRPAVLETAVAHTVLFSYIRNQNTLSTPPGPIRTYGNVLSRLVLTSALAKWLAEFPWHAPYGNDV